MLEIDEHLLITQRAGQHEVEFLEPESVVDVRDRDAALLEDETPAHFAKTPLVDAFGDDGGHNPCRGLPLRSVSVLLEIAPHSRDAHEHV